MSARTLRCALVRQARGGPSALSILQGAAGPLTLAAICGRSTLCPATIARQLRALRAAGLAWSEPRTPRGPGRPALVWTLGRAPEQLALPTPIPGVHP